MSPGTNSLDDMDKGFGGIADISSIAGSETILIMPAQLVARFCTGLF
ncbi:hypothetical protein N3553_22500 [Pantoea dispersa]|nr:MULTISPECIES: hypothetical protein [Pantoea]MCT6592645.1 hypothetical protein [Pantoea dispersa]MCW0322703.1 hypothetical protein [Pantoea dispersa]MCW0327343.1 hypothetical protein [Pantoea dispersa]MCW0433768.1 hypothetical protein [Pantoea dispersa]